MRNVLLSVFAASACLMAQENSISAAIKMEFGMAKGVIARSAEKVPEDKYSFKATDEVRSFGQLVGHVADSQYAFCSAVLGEKSPMADSIEKSKTTKADLVKALNDAFAYCDKAYNAITDSAGAQIVNFFGRDVAKLGVLAFNNMHDYEHYGNMVTYMRLNKIVPPSSEPRPQQKK
jgi:uncharacterized damage-inducible protein DinB